MNGRQQKRIDPHQRGHVVFHYLLCLDDGGEHQPHSGHRGLWRHAHVGHSGLFIALGDGEKGGAGGNHTDFHEAGALI